MVITDDLRPSNAEHDTEKDITMTTLAMRGLWLAWGLLLSLIIGITGGALVYLGGSRPASATMTGAGTFSATLTLILLIICFLTPSTATTPRRRR